MAYKKNRTTTAVSQNGQMIHVGDGVNWGFNGDAYPGTVCFVSDSGREVKVSPDKYKVLSGVLYEDRAQDVEFTKVDMPIEEMKTYKLNKFGIWKKGGDRHDPQSNAWALQFGRVIAHNPSF